MSKEEQPRTQKSNGYRKETFEFIGEPTDVPTPSVPTPVDARETPVGGNVENVENGVNVVTVETTEEKVLVFNPGGFAVRVILSAVLTFLLLRSANTDNVFGFVIEVLTNFAVMYAVLTFAGFLLRLSGNYLVAIVLLIAAGFGYSKLFDYVTTHGMALEIAFNIVFTIILIALIVRDIRKLILYIKYVR